MEKTEVSMWICSMTVLKQYEDLQGGGQNMLNKFIGDKDFYKKIMFIAFPIIIQNGMTNLVSFLDNMMVGKLGTEQMSGVAIVNQLLFIFFLCIFGAISGAGIFSAQFFGKKDIGGVRSTFRYKIWITAIF